MLTVRTDDEWPTPWPRSEAPRTVLRNEIWIVFALSLGSSAVYAIIQFLADLTARGGIAGATATLNNSQAPGRPWLDLTYQLVGIGFALAPVALAVHLLRRDHGQPLRVLGLDLARPGRDLAGGVGLAAVIGIPGILGYLAGRALGLTVNVEPNHLPKIWWAIPVLVLSAAQNALVEEVVVVGYLLTRLRDLRWRPWPAIATSALIRGSYHLYQGVGPFLGNALMGVVFGYVYRRWGRIAPLVVAHTILDIVSFVGYDVVKSIWPGLLT